MLKFQRIMARQKFPFPYGRGIKIPLPLQRGIKINNICLFWDKNIRTLFLIKHIFHSQTLLYVGALKIFIKNIDAVIKMQRVYILKLK